MDENSVCEPKADIYLKSQDVETGEYTKSKILMLVRKFDEPVYQVFTGDRLMLECSHNHYLYTEGHEYVPVSAIQDGLRVFTSDGELLPVSVKETSTVHPILDVQLETVNNYFAGGLLSHNSPEVVGVGNALKFYASIRVDIRRTGTNKEMGEAVSNHSKVKIKKNKTAPPFQEAEFDIVFGVGIDHITEVIDEAVAKELVEKRGSWFTYVDQDTGEIVKRQGKPNFGASIVELELVDQIEKRLTSTE